VNGVLKRTRLLAAASAAVLLSVLMLVGARLLWSPHRNALAYHLHAYWLDARGRGQEYWWVAPPPGFSGTWRTWDRKWRLQAIEPYLDGRMNGEVTYFFDSGLKSQQLSLVKGVQHGADLFWDKQGQLRTLQVNENGRELLRVTLWPLGKLKEVCPYNEQGQKHGVVQRWNGQGVLVSAEVWKDGTCVAPVLVPEDPGVSGAGK
jgi:hypothetical protein